MGGSREHPENLARKKMDKGNREKPCWERKDLEESQQKEKWVGLVKNSQPTEFQGSNCAYSIRTEAKRRSDFLGMKSREFQVNLDEEIWIKEGNDTEGNLWSRSDTEPEMFWGFWAAPRGEGTAW